MDRLIYTALSGMRGAMGRQTVTANNLANANTVGFRAEMQSARSLWVRGAGLETRAPVSRETSGADMSAGSMNHTGRDLDVAMTGDALLTVQAEDGSEAYTRRGDLQVAATGVLTTGDGRPVLGESGPITLPPADSVRIAEDGAIWIGRRAATPASPAGRPAEAGLARGLARRQGARRPVPADGWWHPAVRSVGPAGFRQPRRLQRQDEPDPDRHDRGQPVLDMQLKLVSSARDMDTSAADLMRMPS